MPVCDKMRAAGGCQKQLHDKDRGHSAASKTAPLLVQDVSCNSCHIPEQALPIIPMYITGLCKPERIRPMVGMLLLLYAMPLQSQVPEDGFLTGHGRFDVRGQYGNIPVQTTATERDYEWWRPGDVGFWQYHLELGGQAVFKERVTVRLTLTARSRDSDRDFVTWGNEVNLNTRLKEAGIRLDHLWSSRLALAAGRQQVDYPLFTLYDYVGGRLIVDAASWLTVDWGQWQVFEGRNVDVGGKSSDDIDLWGPQARFHTPGVNGRFYALIHSKAGGSDGIGNNIRIFGLSSEITRIRHLTLGASGVYQHGNSSTPIIGHKDVRAWAIHGRLRYRLPYAASLGVEYWGGSGDKIGTPGVNEDYQQLGYRNTLDKSTLFYRPAMTNLRLLRVTVEGTMKRLTGQFHAARVGERTPRRLLGTEIGVSLAYRYSERVRLRWRYGTAFDGHKMQVFEMSSVFSDVPR